MLKMDRKTLTPSDQIIYAILGELHVINVWLQEENAIAFERLGINRADAMIEAIVTDNRPLSDSIDVLMRQFSGILDAAREKVKIIREQTEGTDSP